MRKVISISIAVFLLTVCYARTEARNQSAITPGARVIKLRRIKTPPVIDGRLDDACWKKIKPITGFLAYRTNKLAEQQTIGYVSYDDSHLYIAAKCLMPGKKVPFGSFLAHDSNIWEHDAVEIMIDPGYSKDKYYQLIINAYSATFDCSRDAGGAGIDIAWNGEWTGKSYIGENFWSFEIAIPFHNLGIKPNIGSMWGFNLCRNNYTQKPRILSSIAINGEFGVADNFAVLKGLKVDFSKYLFNIGPQVIVADLSPENAMAVLTMPIKNLTNNKQKVKIDIHRERSDGKPEIESQIVTLDKNDSISLMLEKIELVPKHAGMKYVYTIERSPRSKKVVVSHPSSGVIFSTNLVKVVDTFAKDGMRVTLKDPWHFGMSCGKTTSIPISVFLGYSKKVLDKMTLSADLLTHNTGIKVASEIVKGPNCEQKLRIYTRKIPWGAYDILVKLTDAQGKEIASVSAPTTILPGGKQQIKILNNLVSELMNVKDRGLLEQKTITFMNPREGWCFFSMLGNVQVKIDSETKPIVMSRSDTGAAEAMRRLSVGKHTLHIVGQPKQIIVRSIPELVFMYHTYNDCYIKPFGSYDWNGFVKKYVFPNHTTMMGIRHTKDISELMPEWVKLGRSFVTHGSVPHSLNYKDEQSFIDACYKRWAPRGAGGVRLWDGNLCDEFGGNNGKIFDVYRKAIEKINTNFSGYRFMPNEERLTKVFDAYRKAVEKDIVDFSGYRFMPFTDERFYLKKNARAHKFMQAVFDGGGYVAPENYLIEQPTEEQAWRFLTERMVDAVPLWEEVLPGAIRRMVVVLAHVSVPPWTVSTDPSVNFSVYLDMQMRIYATDPAFFGLAGLFGYNPHQSQVEVVKWFSRLVRHYAIEGNTEPFTKNPYMLTHIKNPDFANDLDGWTIQPAEPGSIQTKSHKNYRKKQGRWFGAILGDTFLHMKRSAKRPNIFSQQINGLEPGRLYSMKMITSDYQDLVQKIFKKKQHAISIKLNNVEIQPGSNKNFQYAFMEYRTHRENHWMNYHWRVFRAKATSAKLTVSDWKSEKEPGGPIGQELTFNFIEIQPYIDE